MEQTHNLKRTCMFSFLVILLIIITACNDEKGPSEDVRGKEEVRSIGIIGVGQMKFVVSQNLEDLVTGQQIGNEYELEQILAQPGEEIRIRLDVLWSAGAGSAPHHNFVLLKAGTDVDQFVRDSKTARDNNYIAPDMEDQVIVSTNMLGGGISGESDTIQFTVPTDRGTYVFICSFPEHYAKGMHGEIVVE